MAFLVFISPPLILLFSLLPFLFFYLFTVERELRVAYQANPWRFCYFCAPHQAFSKTQHSSFQHMV